MVATLLQAKRYAQAIFEIALEQNTCDEWLKDLEILKKLAQDSTLVSFMENPGISFEQKSALVTSYLQDLNISPLARNFILLLIGKGKFNLCLDILGYYQELLDEHRGVTKAEVTTAIPLDEEERLQLCKGLETATGKKINLIQKVDPGIIGGIIINIGGKLVDGSTSSQLAALKNELAGAGS